MYCTVIKHDRHLRIRGKCRKHEPQASVFYISPVFPNGWSVLSECTTRLRLLHFLYDMDFTHAKHAFPVLYYDKTWVFDQSECAQGPLYITMFQKQWIIEWCFGVGKNKRNVGEKCPFLRSSFTNECETFREKFLSKIASYTKQMELYYSLRETVP